MDAKPKKQKTGGRQKGTPNKCTSMMRDEISAHLSEYFGTSWWRNDLRTLDPRDRLLVAEKYLQYVLPKLQATSVDIQATQKTKIEDMLAELLDE